jgi:hypothetical protein
MVVAEESATGPLRVLVVDDERALLPLLDRYLRSRRRIPDLTW